MGTKRPTRAQVAEASKAYGDVSGAVDAMTVPASVATLARSFGKRAGEAFIAACVNYLFFGEEPQGLTKRAQLAFDSLRETMDRRRVGKMTGGAWQEDEGAQPAENLPETGRKPAENRPKTGRFSEEAYQVEGEKACEDPGGGIWDMGYNNGVCSVSEVLPYSESPIRGTRRPAPYKAPPCDETPTREQVMRFARDHGIDEGHAEDFYEQNEAHGWTTRNGERIHNWCMALIVWDEKYEDEEEP